MIKRFLCWLLGHDFDYEEYARYLDSGKPKRNPATFYCVRCKQLRKLSGKPKRNPLTFYCVRCKQLRKL